MADSLFFIRALLLSKIKVEHFIYLDEAKILENGENIVPDMTGSHLEHVRPRRDEKCPDFM